MKPTVGRIVHFVPEDLEHEEHRPAIIVRVVEDEDPFRCWLMYFMDPMYDKQGYTGAGYFDYDERRLPGTWHWPEREDSQ